MREAEAQVATGFPILHTQFPCGIIKAYSKYGGRVYLTSFEDEMPGPGPVVDGMPGNPADHTESSPCLGHVVGPCVVCCLVGRVENMLPSLFSHLS